MRYEVFRLSLMANTRPPLLEIISPARSERISRQLYLQKEFSGRIDFTHRGRDFTYVHIDGFDDRIVARIGRRGLEAASADPDLKFAPIEEERFQAVNVYIDTASDPDGQKVAMQDDKRIGRPSSVLESLVSHINSRIADQPYEIAVHPVVKEQDFWAVVEAHKGEITTLRIQLSAPNVLGLGASLPKEMRDAKEQNNVSRASVTLENKNGIRVDTPDVRETIAYVLAGGGDAILRAAKKVLFNSKRSIESVSVGNDEPVSVARRDVAAEVAKKIFGR